MSTETRPFVVTGWFTPDYIHWVEPLVGDLERLGHLHDFKQVMLPARGLDRFEPTWEERTLLKAREIAKAMDRWPNFWIVNLDVDCRVLKPLDGLVQGFRSDVGIRITRCAHCKLRGAMAQWRGRRPRSVSQ
jgi:hypothetical protein